MYLKNNDSPFNSLMKQERNLYVLWRSSCLKIDDLFVENATQTCSNVLEGRSTETVNKTSKTRPLNQRRSSSLPWCLPEENMAWQLLTTIRTLICWNTNVLLTRRSSSSYKIITLIAIGDLYWYVKRKRKSHWSAFIGYRMHFSLFAHAEPFFSSYSNIGCISLTLKP